MSEKIMIADDERDIIFLLKDYLSFNDYEVITAYSAEEADKKPGGKISFYNDSGAVVSVEI